MLNKHNLRVARFASKESSRYTLQAILVEPSATVATDGHTLVWVSTPTDKPEDFPVVDGAPKPTREFAPFLLALDAAAAIEKALPRKSTIPVLMNAAISTEPNGDGASRPVITVTDLETPQVFRPGKVDGRFPQYENVMPKEDAKPVFTIELDAAKLEALSKAFREFTHESNPQHHTVRIEFYGADKAVRFDANNCGQGMTGLLMPHKAGEKRPERTYGWKPEEKPSKEQE